MVKPDIIKWPIGYDPAHTSVHVHNEIEIRAKPEKVWGILVEAAEWPSWYKNSSDVVIEGGGVLHEKAQFRWKTFGVSLRSEVAEFVPFERLAWTARSLGVDACHSWLILGTPTGCRVITEENQKGVLAMLADLIMPGRMHRWHEAWLEGLRKNAEPGP